MRNILISDMETINTSVRWTILSSDTGHCARSANNISGSGIET